MVLFGQVDHEAPNCFNGKENVLKALLIEVVHIMVQKNRAP
jgi:hypothetical protein